MTNAYADRATAIENMKRQYGLSLLGADFFGADTNGVGAMGTDGVSGSSPPMGGAAMGQGPAVGNQQPQEVLEADKATGANPNPMKKAWGETKARWEAIARMFGGG